MNELPIGIFDSGIGGLTVLRALHARLPAESFLYLGDTARVPYGTKSPETVIRYSLRVADHLVRGGIKMLVVACNTASAHAMDALRERYPDLPLVGVVEPGAEAALAASPRRHIAVLATEGTIRSGAYRRALEQQDAALTSPAAGAGAEVPPGVVIEEQACPLFVPLAEEGLGDDPIADLAAQRYLQRLAGSGIDTAILGCTHYPLLMPAIARVLPGVTLVDSARTTAEAVAGLLTGRKLLSAGSPATTRYLLTDVSPRFAEVGARFLGRPVDPIELVDV